MALLVLPVLIGLTGCDPLPSIDAPVGFSLARSGAAVEIRFPLCPGDAVTSLTVVIDKGTVVGGSEDPVLWKVASTPGVAREVFRVGTTPEGFDEEVALRSPLPTEGELGDDEEIGAVITTEQILETGGGYPPEELRSDSVFALDRSMSASEFEELALRRCAND